MPVSIAPSIDFVLDFVLDFTRAFTPDFGFDFTPQLHTQLGAQLQPDCPLDIMLELHLSAQAFVGQIDRTIKLAVESALSAHTVTGSRMSVSSAARRQ